MLRWMAGSCAGTTPPVPGVAAGTGAAGAAAPPAGAALSKFGLAGAGATAPPPWPDEVDEVVAARLQPASTRPAHTRPVQTTAIPVRQREIEGVMRVRRRASRGRFRQTGDNGVTIRQRTRHGGSTCG